MTRHLLDTNALIWWLTDDSKLTAKARTTLADPRNEIFVSAASGWELATKVRIGKWERARTIIQDLPSRLANDFIGVLAIDLPCSLMAGSFDHPHRDPFDRMIAAQAIVHDMNVVSADEVFDQLVKRRVW
jgi:PIN domain nuclease of toxin-antitoxin system